MIGFVVLAVVLVAGGVGVVTLRQPVHAALALVGTILALAVTYVTLQAHFLAAIQVIVYAGAIMVLFLFVIMLLNVSNPFQKSTMPWLKPAAWISGVLLAASVGTVGLLMSQPLPASADITAALRGGGADAIGGILFSDYLLAFHLVGVLLLTGVIGAVSLVQRAAPETRPIAQRQGGFLDPEGPELQSLAEQELVGGGQ